jgi:tRNA (guanine26-N2/guanine27-N2)-dimethyltransferase
MTITKEYMEGKTRFLAADVDHYAGDHGQPTTSMPVFYNPRMRLNRDFSVLFLTAYLEKNPIDLLCEPLAGCGVRTLRYLNECPGDFPAFMFDANPVAMKIMNKNIKINGVSKRVETRLGDAKILLLTESREKRFSYVDVDPFGTPAPYLNAAFQSLKPKNSLMALTATDMPALCGQYPRVAQRIYGGLSIKTPFSHELAVRLLIGLSYHIAGINDFSVEPLAVLSADHYIRTWLKVNASCEKANRNASNMGFVHYCPDCMHADVVPLRESLEHVFQHQISKCQGKILSAGPLWIGSLFDTKFIKTATKEYLNYEKVFHNRVFKLLRMMKEETELMTKPYIDLHALCDLHNFIPPKMNDVIDKLVEKGFRVSRTHFRPTAIRTTALVNDVADVVVELGGKK